MKKKFLKNVKCPLLISDSKPVEGRVLDNDEAVSGGKILYGHLTDFKMSLLLYIVTSLPRRLN